MFAHARVVEHNQGGPLLQMVSGSMLRAPGMSNTIVHDHLAQHRSGPVSYVQLLEGVCQAFNPFG